MSKKLEGERFDALVKKAEEFNSRNGFKRFYPINSREGKVMIYGMYDYTTKKYALSEPFIDVTGVFNEIEQMLKVA